MDCFEFNNVCYSYNKGNSPYPNDEVNGDLNSLQMVAVFSNSHISQKLVPTKTSLSLFAITPLTSPTPLYTLKQWCIEVYDWDDNTGGINCTNEAICEVSPGYFFQDGSKVPDFITWSDYGFRSQPFPMNFEIVY
jgi:hypothetical protein